MRFQRLDLNHLVTLEALLTESSLTKAAERMSLTQPAISNALNKLREFFGDGLLVRRGRNMVRTPFAETMLPQLRSALLELRSVTLARPGFDPMTGPRHLTIVASDYVATVFIAELSLRLADLAPNVSLSHVPIGTDANAKFERGEIDAIILPDGHLTFSQHPKLVLFTDDWVCVARTDNPTVGNDLTALEYYSLPRIVPPFNDFWPEVNWGSPRTAHAGTTVSLPFSAAPWLVARSNYIAILPERLAALFESKLPLRRVKLPQDLPRSEFVLQWHADTANDPFTLWMLEKMQEVGAELESAPLDSKC